MWPSILVSCSISESTMFTNTGAYFSNVTTHLILHITLTATHVQEKKKINAAQAEAIDTFFLKK